MLTAAVAACMLTYSTVGLTPVWDRAVDKAVEAWSAAGWTITEVAADSDITIRFGELDPARWPANGARMDYWAGYYDTTTNTIVLNNNRNFYPGDRALTVTHELGHAFRIPHSENPAELMYPVPGHAAPPRCMV